MPVAFFIGQYERITPHGLALAARRPTILAFQPQIEADAGDLRIAEFLGGRWLAKVRASAATLTAIDGAAGIFRLPLAALDNPLSSLTNGQRTAIRNEALAAGYTSTEINAAFPNLADATLGQVLRFFLTRRLKPRYDQATDSIVLDGPEQPVVAIEALEAVQ